MFYLCGEEKKKEKKGVKFQLAKPFLTDAFISKQNINVWIYRHSLLWLAGTLSFYLWMEVKVTMMTQETFLPQDLRISGFDFIVPLSLLPLLSPRHMCSFGHRHRGLEGHKMDSTKASRLAKLSPNAFFPPQCLPSSLLMEGALVCNLDICLHWLGWGLGRTPYTSDNLLALTGLRWI